VRTGGGSGSGGSHALLQLVGADRPGLLSEVFTVLHNLHCDIFDARRWTHDEHVVVLVFVRNEKTGASIRRCGSY
jgi:predicted amino acid-binding ACT domain protein